MTSHCLVCDECGAEIGTQHVVKNREPHWTDVDLLLNGARERGWRVGSTWRTKGVDYCPKCAKLKE